MNSSKLKLTAHSGTKDDSSKPKLDLIPLSALEEIAKVLEYGCKKYAKNNYKKGLEYSRLIAAALRHIHQFNEKIDLDEESGESHAAHAATNLIMLLWMINNKPDMDDR